MMYVRLHRLKVPQCVARKREQNQFHAKIEYNWNETHIEKKESPDSRPRPVSRLMETKMMQRQFYFLMFLAVRHVFKIGNR